MGTAADLDSNSTLACALGKAELKGLIASTEGTLRRAPVPPPELEFDVVVLVVVVVVVVVEVDAVEEPSFTPE